MKNYKYYRELSQLPPLIKNLVIGEVYPEDTVLDLYGKHATEKSTLTIAEYILMMPDQTYFTRVSNSVKEAFDELMDRGKEKSLRYNNGKLKWSLVHYKSLEPLVKVLMFGAKKYSPDNWKKGLNRKEVLESTMRHLTDLMDGEENDIESNESHIGHIQCNMMFYTFHKENNSFTPDN